MVQIDWLKSILNLFSLTSQTRPRGQRSVHFMAGDCCVLRPSGLSCHWAQPHRTLIYIPRCRDVWMYGCMDVWMSPQPSPYQYYGFGCALSKKGLLLHTQYRHVPEENPRFSMYQEFIEIYWRWQNSIDNFPQPTAGGRIQIWNIFSLPLPIVSLELQPSTLDYSVFETLARVDTLITSLLRKY